jgi:hypothetical protein
MTTKPDDKPDDKIETKPVVAEKPAAEKPKAKAKVEPEHEDPYPSQADIDATKLGMAKAGEYLTRVETPAD